MDTFEAIKTRRSIRKFLDKPVQAEHMEKGFDAAILAPNSSNMQTWDFYWVKDETKKKKLVQACLNQSAARTAAELVVITADPKKWRRSNPQMIKFVKDVKAPKLVITYYEKLIPYTYTWGIFSLWGLIKKILANIIGIFRPMTRHPNTKRDLQEVAIKSAALASENFVLAMTAQGYQTCMMEGHDEWRVKGLLNLPFSSRVVMVIAVGVENKERGTWGPQIRLPKEDVVHHI